MEFYTKTADWRSPIPFWNVHLEAEIVLGVLYRKGGIPKKVGTSGSRVPIRKMLQILEFRAPGKANLPEPWVDTAWTLSPPSVRGVF